MRKDLPIGLPRFLPYGKGWSRGPWKETTLYGRPNFSRTKILWVLGKGNKRKANLALQVAVLISMHLPKKPKWLVFESSTNYQICIAWTQATYYHIEAPMAMSGEIQTLVHGYHNTVHGYQSTVHTLFHWAHAQSLRFHTATIIKQNNSIV